MSNVNRSIINEIYEIIVLLHAVLMRLHLMDCIRSGALHLKKNIDLWKKSLGNQQ